MAKEEEEPSGISIEQMMSILATGQEGAKASALAAIKEGFNDLAEQAAMLHTSFREAGLNEEVADSVVIDYTHVLFAGIHATNMANSAAKRES